MLSRLLQQTSRRTWHRLQNSLDALRTGKTGAQKRFGDLPQNKLGPVIRRTAAGISCIEHTEIDIAGRLKQFFNVFVYGTAFPLQQVMP